ncbi:MAG: hypothetical protein M1281_04550 [Chloroflexi bacterium]|nr:hypothetical protein [Chloroflexota bacterium]
MGTRDILDIVLAIVAVASVIVTILTYRASRKDKQPSIRTTIGHGWLGYDGGTRLANFSLLFSIANSGDKPIRVVEATILVKKLHVLIPRGIPGTHNLPFDLSPSEKATFWLGLKEFSRDLYDKGCRGKQTVKAYFADTVGNEYISKSFKIDVDEWAKGKS